MKATNIRKGNILRISGTLYRVMSMDHVTPGKGRAHVQTKLRKLADGTQTETRFRSTDDVEKVTGNKSRSITQFVNEVLAWGFKQETSA